MSGIAVNQAYGSAPTPNPVIVNRMQAYDPQLCVGWNARQGKKAPLGRWIIGRQRMKGSGMAHIMTVQNDDGSYRPLDDRTMTRLRMIDSWRVGHKEQTAQLQSAWDLEEKLAAKKLDEDLDAKIDKMGWALRKDTENWSFSSVDR